MACLYFFSILVGWISYSVIIKQMQSKEILLCILTFFVNWDSFLWIDLLFAKSVLTKISDSEMFSQMFARACDQSSKPHGSVVPKALIPDVGNQNPWQDFKDRAIWSSCQGSFPAENVQNVFPQRPPADRSGHRANWPCRDWGHKLYLPIYWVSLLSQIFPQLNNIDLQVFKFNFHSYYMFPGMFIVHLINYL